MHTARRTHGFTESVIRGMTRLANAARRHQPGPGLPQLSRAPSVLKEAAAARRSRPTSTSTPSPGAPSGCATPSPRKYARLVRAGGGPRDRDHRHLRRDRGHGRGAAGAGRSRRRGDRVRAVLRELRPRRDPVRRASRSTSRSLPEQPARSRPAAPRPSRRGPGPSSSTRPTTRRGTGLTRAELEAIAELLPPPRRLRGHRRDLRAHPLRGRAHPASRRSPGMRERTITISGASKTFSVTGWRIGTIVAPPRGRPTRSARCTTSSPWARRRRCRRRSPSGSRRCGATTTTRLARDYRRGATSCAARSARPASAARRPQGAYYVLADFSALSDLPDDRASRELAHARARRRAGARLELPRRAGAGPPAGALRLLQDRGDAGAGGGAAGGHPELMRSGGLLRRAAGADAPRRAVGGREGSRDAEHG